jgi:hypothetical protein
MRTVPVPYGRDGPVVRSPYPGRCCYSRSLERTADGTVQTHPIPSENGRHGRWTGGRVFPKNSQAEKFSFSLIKSDQRSLSLSLPVAHFKNHPVETEFLNGLLGSWKPGLPERLRSAQLTRIVTLFLRRSTSGRKSRLD